MLISKFIVQFRALLACKYIGKYMHRCLVLSLETPYLVYACFYFTHKLASQINVYFTFLYVATFLEYAISPFTITKGKVISSNYNG